MPEPTRTWMRTISAIALLLVIGGTVGTAHAYSLPLSLSTGDYDWRAIGPVGNTEVCCSVNSVPLDTVGVEWEAANVGWNTSVSYDDSGWSFGIVTLVMEPPLMWVDGNGENGSTPAYFRRVFAIPGTPTLGQLVNFGVDDDAQVYVNGYLVVDDRNGMATPITLVDVTDRLVAGENLIAVKAHDSFGWKEGIHFTLKVEYADHLVVRLDIKPGSFPNAINLSSAGVVPVAILGSADFDAMQVNPLTVTLAGASVKLIGKGDKSSCAPDDVNGDGFVDLVCHVVTAQFLIEPGQSMATLEAYTFGGQKVMGQDSIEIVPTSTTTY